MVKVGPPLPGQRRLDGKRCVPDHITNSKKPLTRVKPSTPKGMPPHLINMFKGKLCNARTVEDNVMGMASTSIMGDQPDDKDDTDPIKTGVRPAAGGGKARRTLESNKPQDSVGDDLRRRR